VIFAVSGEFELEFDFYDVAAEFYRDAEYHGSTDDGDDVVAA
jgi:hypothetical protein